MFLYKIYHNLSWAVTPFAKLYVKHRISKGREDINRYKEKFAITKEARPKGKLVWIHTASVGELNSILPMIRLLTEKKLTVLVTSITTTSYKIFDNAKLKKAIHQYAPLDLPAVIDEFLAHWKPDLAMFVDSELWPNMIVKTSEVAPMLLVNARLSDKSFVRWTKAPSLINFLLSKFTKIFPCSEPDREKFATFCPAEKIEYIGNLKYAVIPQEIPQNVINVLKKLIGKRTIWICSSTHAGEEEFIFEAHKLIQKKQKDILTIIAPRHPSRGNEIAKMAKAEGLKIAQRTKSQIVAPNTDIYIADTIGELNLFYSLADYVFIGGSLINHGGHNILEPARQECAIITGKHTHNFREIVDEFYQADALLVVDSAAKLAECMLKLLADPKKQKQLAKNALHLSDGKNKILDETIKHILPYIEHA